jgi:hypothetical protein
MKLKRKEYELVVKYIMDLQKQINELRKEVCEQGNKVNEVESDVYNKQNKDILCTAPSAEVYPSNVLLHDPCKEAGKELEKRNEKKKRSDIDIAWGEETNINDVINKAESV